MPSLTVMTELEAVNEMLLSIGQAPVNSLNVTGIRDVSIAKFRLDTALRKVLTRGWAFNTDTAYNLSPDIDGIILIPSDALKVDSDGADVTVRTHPDKGRALYNRATRSFEFSDPVACTIVWAMGFEDIPQSARDYIAINAARRFQSKSIGSQILDRFEENDETLAWIDLLREERASRNTNIFRSNPAVAGFGDRSH